MTTPAPGQVETAEEMAALTGERVELPAIGESFTARDRAGFELRWEDGEFTSSWPPYLEAVKAMIDSGATVVGFSTGPQTKAGATPGWVAITTAQEALYLEELDWDDRNIEYPVKEYGYPPGAVA